MERLSEKGLYNTLHLSLSSLILFTGVQWHQVRDPIQPVLVICTNFGNSINLEHPNRNILRINGVNHASSGYFAIIEGEPETGISALVQYGYPDQIIDIPEDERLTQRVSFSTRYLYNPGNGFRTTYANLRKSLTQSIQDVKEILPIKCYTQFLRNA